LDLALGNFQLFKMIAKVAIERRATVFSLLITHLAILAEVCISGVGNVGNFT